MRLVMMFYLNLSKADSRYLDEGHFAVETHGVVPVVSIEYRSANNRCAVGALRAQLSQGRVAGPTPDAVRGFQS